MWILIVEQRRVSEVTGIELTHEVKLEFRELVYALKVCETLLEAGDNIKATVYFEPVKEA